MKPKFNIDSYHKKFRNCVIKSFTFLIKKFDFKIVKEGKAPYVYSYRMTYKNKTTAINISYDVRDEGISVLIYRLVNGEIPGYPIFVRKNTVINCYYLDRIIAVRSSSPDEELYTKKHAREFPPIYDAKTIEKIVNEYGEALEKYGTDILTGDFSVFTKLEKELKESNKNRSAITYNISHKEYDKKKEEKIRKDHEKQFGKEVKCIIKYYKSK